LTQQSVIEQMTMAESRVILLLILDKVRDIFGALTIDWCWTAFFGDFPQGP